MSQDFNDDFENEYPDILPNFISDRDLGFLEDEGYDEWDAEYEWNDDDGWDNDDGWDDEEENSAFLNISAEFENLISEVNRICKTLVFGNSINKNDNAVFNILFGNDSTAVQDGVIDVYISNLMYKEYGNKYSQTYINEMNSLVKYIFDESNISSVFSHYNVQFSYFFEALQYRIFDFCTEYEIENWSDESINDIKALLQGIAKCKWSPTGFNKFEELETRVNSEGKSFGTNIKERYFIALLIIKYDDMVDNYLYVPALEEVPSVENYYLNYASEALSHNSIEEIWRDNLVNGVIQLRNTNRLSENNPDTPELKELNKAIQIFIEKYFSEEKIAECKTVLQNLVSKYANQEFDNPSEQIEFVEAYKVLYLYELLSNKQKEAAVYPINYDLFLFRHLNSFKNQCITTSIDVEKLIMRAVQSTSAKEVHERLSSCKEEIDTSLVVNKYFDVEYCDSLAAAGDYGDYLMFTNQAINPEMYGRTLRGVVSHELDHIIKSKMAMSNLILCYDDYKVFKYQFMNSFDSRTYFANHANEYFEVSADCAGALAEIKLLKLFSAGEDTAAIQAKINAQTDVIKKKITSTIDNSLRYQKDSSMELGINKDLAVFDDFYKKEAKNKTHPLLNFEYHIDGTPKTLDEIIKNQEEEFASGVLSPNVKPDNLVERAKIRFQIMMERAMMTNQEKDCYCMMIKHLRDYKDRFENDDLFRIDFPNKEQLTSDDFDTLITDLLKDGEYQGFQKVLFLVRLQAMAEKVKDTKAKETFGKSVLSFFESAFGLDGQSSVVNDNTNYIDQIPE